jgi:N-acetylmuramoyl-L-alanine amidase
MIPLEVVKIIAEVDIKWENQTKTLSINTIRPYLLEVRSYSHLDKTRVVIDLSEKTEFKGHKLTNPDRIFINIMGSVVKLEDTSKQIEINDGVIKTVRTAQFNQEITRVVFDLYQESKYELFSLIEPDRVVVDIFKTGEKAAISEPLPAKTEEKPAPGPEITGKRVVIIDPGHGGKDPGAINRTTGLKESEVTLGIALYLEKLLKNAGIPTYLTRYKDEFIYLEDRTNFANQKNGFVFVSLHANSVLNPRPSAQGIETFVLSSKYIGASARDVADRENIASRAHPELDADLAKIIADLEESANIKYSLDFAEIVQKKLVNYLKLEDRGVKQAPFVVLKGANMVAVIVEVAFISNPKEEKLLKTDKFRENAARALFEAIKYYIENTPDNGG